MVHLQAARWRPNVGFVGVHHIPCAAKRPISMHMSEATNRKSDSVIRVGRYNFDPSVYLVTDRRVTPGWTVDEIVKKSIKGHNNKPGVTFVQLRDKNEDLQSSLKLGRLIRDITKQKNIAFVVNDDIELAKSLKADGVHVGQDDRSVYEARCALGENAIIGVSAGTPSEALQAIEDGADYIGVGSVFATASKPDAGHPIGPQGLDQIIQVVNNKIPVVAIGGISVQNAHHCWSVGADGVAVVSAIMKSHEPNVIAAQLHRS